MTGKQLRRAATRLRGLLRAGSGDPLQSVPPQLMIEHRGLLEGFASGRWVALRFPPALEVHFRADTRESSRAPRAFMALLTALLFLTAPWWTGPLLDVPEKTRAITLYLSLLGLAPMFLLLTFCVWNWPRSVWVENFLIVAFVVEAAAIEALRLIAEGHGYPVSGFMSLAVPIAVVAVGRLSLFRSIALVGLYLAVIEAKYLFFPNPVWERHATDYLAMFIILAVCLFSTGFTQRIRRRTWALLQLMRLRADADFLTGLPNRSAFEQHVERWVRWGRRHQTPYVIALIDLDFFKRINDRYGHAFGDGVLMEAGMVLSAYARRGGDLAARIGGEEFALFLFNCDAQAAHQRLEELRAAIMALDIAHEDSPLGVVTASIGAVCRTLPEPISSSYQKADENLYAVKRAGRNGVRISTDTMPGAPPAS